MGDFNAAQARAKRPCPLWVDAFQRDTQHLEADEVGAYFLILMAMWTRESCDFPDDDTRLARVSRVSVRLWKSRIGPILREFFKTADGALFSKRLRGEATYVERQVKHQSDRKSGEKSDKPLENNNLPSTADNTVDSSAEVSFPTTQQPTLKTPLTPQGVPFADFWTSWPNKTGKAAAEKAWKKLGPQDRETAAGSARSWFEAWRRKHPDASPIHPASFLNGRRWEDEADKPQTSGDRYAGAVHSIKSGKAFLCGGISASLARELIQLGRVTEAECREVRVI